MRAFLAAVLAMLAGPALAADARAYADLVARAEQGDPKLDYTALRLSYAEAPSYDPYGMQTHALFSAAWKAFQDKDCTTAVAAAEAMLKINYLSVPMHAVKQGCFEQAGDAAGAARERAIGRGIAQSLLASGDGKSPATAYIVVTLSEEGLVESYLGFKEERQALINDKGHVYDLISGHDDKTGEARSAYFDVGALLAGEARLLGTPSQGPAK